MIKADSSLHKQNIKTVDPSRDNDDYLYNDGFMWKYCYPIIALASVHIANENHFLLLITLPSYYTDILFALFFTYSIGYYSKRIISMLDIKRPWSIDYKKRLIFQFLFNIIIPALLLIITETLYLQVIGIPISESSLFYYELPICVIFLLVINLFYHILYLNNRSSNRTTTAPVIDNIATSLFVSKGDKEIALEFSSISHFYLKDKTVFISTFDQKVFSIPDTLNELQLKLPATVFFRINRQTIASRKSISEVHYTSTRRLNLKIHPSSENEIYVSKANASEFQKWLNRK